MQKINVGIIGCGNISSIYMENIPKFNHLQLVACSDLDMNRAKAQAEKYNIPKVYSVEEMLADEAIDLIINLTIPEAHGNVSLKALEANKHVYVEKPLTIDLDEAQKVMQTAKEKGLFVGGAPDTFLGAGIQTALYLIESGEIGKPVGASAFMLNRGMEHWHPNPQFFYEKGGGPMFDMGPYYLTTLVALFGPIKHLSGMTKINFSERKIYSEPKRGEKINVKVPTHISGTMEFSSGAIATLTTSFDIFGGSTLPNMEIYGSEGTILMPDPNTFDGPVRLRKKDEESFIEVPLVHTYRDNWRGLGVADMAWAILHGKSYRASGELMYHILEAMHGFHYSYDEKSFYSMNSSCEKPSPLFEEKWLS